MFEGYGKDMESDLLIIKYSIICGNMVEIKLWK